jgi:DNA-binding NtrC family response regulator
MAVSWQIVIASSDLEVRRALATVLLRLGLDPVCVSSVDQCREALSQDDVGLIFCSRHLCDGTYLDILAASRSVKGQPRVVLTSRHTHSEYKEAISLGVFDVITAPCRPTDVEWMVIQAKRVTREPAPGNDAPGPSQDPKRQKANASGAA